MLNPTTVHVYAVRVLTTRVCHTFCAAVFSVSLHILQLLSLSSFSSCLSSPASLSCMVQRCVGRGATVLYCGLSGFGVCLVSATALRVKGQPVDQGGVRENVCVWVCACVCVSKGQRKHMPAPEETVITHQEHHRTTHTLLSLLYLLSVAQSVCQIQNHLTLTHLKSNYHDDHDFCNFSVISCLHPNVVQLLNVPDSENMSFED